MTFAAEVASRPAVCSVANVVVTPGPRSRGAGGQIQAPAPVIDGSIWDAIAGCERPVAPAINTGNGITVVCSRIMAPGRPTAAAVCTPC